MRTSMKLCTICKNNLPRSDFYKNRTKPDGLQNVCKLCRKQLDKVRVSNGSEKARKARQLNKMTEAQKIIYRKKLALWRKIDRKRYPEKYQAHRNNRINIFRDRNKDHYQRNKLRYIMRAKNRRARERNAQGVLTPIAIKFRFALYGNLCAYCHQSAILTIDHVKPLIKGGSNWPSNIVPACLPCNSGKQHRSRTPHFPYSPYLPK